MNFTEARALIEQMNLAEGNSLTFKVGIIILLCSSNGNWEVEKIQKATGYKRKEIHYILANLRENQLLVDDTLYMNNPEDEENNWLEFILMTMVGAGKIVAHLEQDNICTSNYMLPAVIYNFPCIPVLEG